MKRCAYLTLLLFWLSSSYSQVEIGQWRDHLPFNEAIDVTTSKTKIYCATQLAIFYLDKEDNSLNRISKVQGLSDIDISTIKYHEGQNILFVGYVNGNIDLITDDNEIINFADIKRSSVTASKRINEVKFVGDSAYLSCGYGISVFDMNKKEFSDSYFLGTNGSFIPVNSTDFYAGRIWAATTAGLYYANAAAPNLTDFSIWKPADTLIKSTYNISELVVYAEKLLINRDVNLANDTIYSYDGNNYKIEGSFQSYDINFDFEVLDERLAISNKFQLNIYDTDFERIGDISKYADGREVRIVAAAKEPGGLIWYADNNSGLGNSAGEHMVPNGPEHSTAYNMDVQNGILWTVSGGQNQSNGNGLGRNAGIHVFRDGSWKSITRENNAFLSQNNMIDVLDIAIDPQDNTKIYASTLGWGIIEVIDDEVIQLYDETNSSLVEENPNNTFHFVGVTGLEYDNSGNLWMLNTRSTQGLQVKTQDDKWFGFSVPPLSNKFYLKDILISKSGYKWMTVRDGDQGLVVFDDGGTFEDPSDDQWLHLKSGEGNGNLPSSTIYSLREDLDGNIWVGTFDGVVVFNNAQNIFAVDNIDAQKILVEKDGYSQYLFESEVITSIDVDGANRKWMGTESSGVFLLSEDGTEEILHFTTDNSPLLSNAIENVSINQKTGEVFISSELGVVSYKGDATGGEVTYDIAYVYPNPVSANYNGPIVITGLLKDSFIKITDVSGNLVHQTQAQGGQATWDGMNFSGNRVNSGVYLVYAYDDNATQRFVSKFLMIK